MILCACLTTNFFNPHICQILVRNIIKKGLFLQNTASFDQKKCFTRETELRNFLMLLK